MSEAIWFKDYQLDEITPVCKVNLTEHLGIELTGLGPDHLVGTMTVDHRTTQQSTLEESKGRKFYNLGIPRFCTETRFELAKVFHRLKRQQFLAVCIDSVSSVRLRIYTPETVP